MSSPTTNHSPFNDTALLIARLTMVALFLPAGISKIGNFAGTAGYIGSVGLPLPELGAAIAIALEILAPLALLAGFGTRTVPWCWLPSRWRPPCSFTSGGPCRRTSSSCSS